MALNFIIFCSITYLIVRSIGCATILRPNVLHANYEVKFLSVVFRHGDRTPTQLYPNDPNTLDDLYPAGLGQLTLAGKAREYQLGIELRHLYKDFLGETYIPYMVNARSTDVDRTKMSLLLVLSALYPPRDKQIWNPALNWQPIPYSYVPRKDDTLLAPDKSSAKYLEELERVRESEEVKAKVEEFYPLMENLTRWTGREINSTNYIYHLFHTLKAETSLGLKLPEWARDDSVHQHMFDATILEYHILNYNIHLRRLYGGTLLRNIIETMEGIANQTIKDGRRIQLFSAHESTVAAFLIAMGVFESHVPEYSSAVIVELLQDHKNQHYVNIRYYLGIPPQTRTLLIPGCSMHPCPIGDFIQLMGNVIATDDDMDTATDENHI